MLLQKDQNGCLSAGDGGKVVLGFSLALLTPDHAPEQAEACDYFARCGNERSSGPAVGLALFEQGGTTDAR